MSEERYLNEKQAAKLIGLSVQTLRNQRFKRCGLPYVKVGRSVRYDIQDIIPFMDNRKVQPETI